jgi:hypothetical protein
MMKNNVGSKLFLEAPLAVPPLEIVDDEAVG